MTDNQAKELGLLAVDTAVDNHCKQRRLNLLLSVDYASYVSTAVVNKTITLRDIVDAAKEMNRVPWRYEQDASWMLPQPPWWNLDQG